MNTFILEWRPSISSYRIEDFENDLEYIEYGEFNWSVWDWQKAHSGDNFYMVKCSEGRTGIVMKGFFTSEPYEADDWSGKNRQVHYMDFRPTFMVHPDKCRMLTTAELESEMPGFQWNGGHSGRILPEELRPVIDGMWDRYLGSLPPEVFDSETAARNDIPEACVDDAIRVVNDAFYGETDLSWNSMCVKILRKAFTLTSEEEMIPYLLQSQVRFDAGRLREMGFREEDVENVLPTGD